MQFCLFDDWIEKVAALLFLRKRRKRLCCVNRTLPKPSHNKLLLHPQRIRVTRYRSASTLCIRALDIPRRRGYSLLGIVHCPHKDSLGCRRMISLQATTEMPSIRFLPALSLGTIQVIAFENHHPDGSLCVLRQVIEKIWVC